MVLVSPTVLAAPADIRYFVVHGCRGQILLGAFWPPRQGQSKIRARKPLGTSYVPILIVERPFFRTFSGADQRAASRGGGHRIRQRRRHHGDILAVSSAPNLATPATATATTAAVNCPTEEYVSLVSADAASRAA